MPSAPRLLVIGLDAASGSVIRHWANTGLLPNIAGLLRQGQTAELSGIDGFFVGSTWPSLLTGTNPAEHGLHYLVQLVPGTYHYARPHEGAYIRMPMFWQSLSEKRLAILDVPLAKLDPAIRGIQTVEWAGHDAIFGFSTSPPELAADIVAKHGTHPVPSDCDADGRSLSDYERFTQTLIAGVRIKSRLTIDLATRERWDLALQVFTESHCVGHQCWHLHDVDHPAYDRTFKDRYGDPVQRVYQALDEAIGEIRAATGNPPTLLLAPHGMSYWYGPNALLPEILSRLGWATRTPPPPYRRSPRDYLKAIQRRMARLLGQAMDDKLGSHVVPGSFRLPPLGFDPRTSRCFVVPNGQAIGGIRLNLAGREPYGTVTREQIPTVVADLRRDLTEIRDQRTGLPVVESVVVTSELHQGANCDALPDVLVKWVPGVARGSTTILPSFEPTIRLGSPKIGTVEGRFDYCRTGEHRPQGFAVAVGPGIEAGKNDLTISTLDVAPTITATLGVSMSTAQGRPVPELIPRLAD